MRGRRGNLGNLTNFGSAISAVYFEVCGKITDIRTEFFEGEAVSMQLKRFLAVTLLSSITLIGAGALAADDSAGKALYDKNCAGCHGADGKGNPAMAKIIGDKGLNITGKDVAKKSDADLLKLVAEGAGKMPASKLSKDEQKQALSYARTLAK